MRPIAWLRCKHLHQRCIHGDEINNRGGYRRVCLDCGRRQPGLAFCTVEGRCR